MASVRGPKVGPVACLLFLCCIQACAGLYDAGGNVKVLTTSKLASALEKKSVVLVEFYAPWCGHCKSLKPEWEKVASALQGLVTVAAVDADADKAAGAEYGVKGFPTIKLLVGRGGGLAPKTVEYKGQRVAVDITRWTLSQVSKLVEKRLGASSGGEGASAGSKTGSRSQQGSAGASNGFYKGTDVLELDDQNFHSTLSESDSPMFVEFYAPWCGHCQALKPTWMQLASQLAGKVRVAAVDCTASAQTCQEFGVQGYPTIKWFEANEARAQDYQGGRDADSLAAFALGKWAASAPPPEVLEIVDDHVWAEHCVGIPGDTTSAKPRQLCFVAFLPHILDAGVEGRNADIQLLKDLADKFKDRPFSFSWSEGGAQPELEANFGVGGYGYPALVAVNPSKAKFASMRSSFVREHVMEFVDAVRTGRERVEDVRGVLATPATVDAWDGQAGKLELEEEFSLEDLMADNDEL